MSGGQWDYGQFRIRDCTDEVSSDELLNKEFPVLAEKIRALGEELHDVIHWLDYHMSGDRIIDDPKAFTEKAITQFFRAIMLGKEEEEEENKTEQ